MSWFGGLALIEEVLNTSRNNLAVLKTNSTSKHVLHLLQLDKQGKCFLSA